VPPHPILSLLVDDCGPYHDLTSAAPSPFCCSTVPSLHDRDAGARSSTTRPHAAHAADGASTAKGVSSRPQCSPAGVRAGPPRCGALVRLLAPRGHRSAHPFQRGEDNSVQTKSPCRCLPRCAPTRSRYPPPRAIPSVLVLAPIKGTPSKPFGRAPPLPPPRLQ
jgi:hypothetical protein